MQSSIPFAPTILALMLSISCGPRAATVSPHEEDCPNLRALTSTAPAENEYQWASRQLIETSDPATAAAAATILVSERANEEAVCGILSQLDRHHVRLGHRSVVLVEWLMEHIEDVPACYAQSVARWINVMFGALSETMKHRWGDIWWTLSGKRCDPLMPTTPTPTPPHPLLHREDLRRITNSYRNRHRQSAAPVAEAPRPSSDGAGR